MANEASGGVLERLTLAEKFIALASAAGIGWTTFNSHTIANEVTLQTSQLAAVQETQKLEIDRQKSRVEIRDADATLTHKIYQEFINAISDHDGTLTDRIDRLSAVLVLTDAIPDPEQKEGMARAVQQAIERVPVQSAQLRNVQEVASFDAENVISRANAEQKMIPAAAPTPALSPTDSGTATWSNYDFDIFWCDGVPDSTELSSRAADVAAFRAKDPKAAGNWRVRPLPLTVNQRPGYQVSGYQVRYSSADELPFAEKMKQMIETKFAGTSVQVVPTTQATPWYVSVYVCP